MPYKTIEHSTYLDFTAYNIATFGSNSTVQDVYGLKSADVQPAATAHINVAIILERANATIDPDVSILSEDWATRQAALSDQGKVWSTYGADPAHYAAVYDALKNTAGLTILDSTNSNYVTSRESRTIWVELDSAADFNTLFNLTEPAEQLYRYVDPADDHGFVFWNGNLSLPEEWKVAGLWFDTENAPEGSPPTTLDPVTLVQGAQGPGNSAFDMDLTLAPQDIAEIYNFPLDGSIVPTGTIGLIEPGVGSYIPGDPDGASLQIRLAQYLESIGQSGTGTVSAQGIDGQSGQDADGLDERSLDLGIVAAVNPNSDVVLYSGSGNIGFARSSTFTAYQSAIWDTIRNPAVTSSSWEDAQSMTPGSPYHEAYLQLFVDAALRNQTTFIMAFDGGSGNETSNGVTNVSHNNTQAYNVIVGGTSLSTLEAAAHDDTLKTSLVASAFAGDPATIWQLVSGGLTSMPDNTATTQYFVEAAWNEYYLDGNDITDYIQNNSGGGGVDPSQPVPSYQVDYGLTPTTSDPLHLTGRGVPDVAANAGGNLWYVVPSGDMVDTSADAGTSAATPFWAALGTQLNAIFADQGLPNLGYMNDLLYMASAIAPASFNDISIGNNISSFFHDEHGKYVITEGHSTRHASPTGYGYFAGPGYDLTTGLGTPNGVLLARALTQIAHSQTSFASVPDVLDSDGSHGWKSGADQTLMFQTMSTASVLVSVDVDHQTSLDFSSLGGGAFAWTSQLAQQSLQEYFDPELVRFYDQYSQGAVRQATVASGDKLTIGINGAATDAIQGNLTSDFGFADFVNDNGNVRVARPVAVAETAGGQDDQTAVVRVRQNGTDKDAITFYRVDDFTGTIDGLAPGQAGYAAAAHARAYHLSSGGTALDGPGYGNYAETRLLDVDAGDLIAMLLDNKSRGETYWAFSDANPQSSSQLWNYSLNTWGWEDRRIDGDHDYNDLIVGIDFTSTAGHGWLA